MKKIIIEVHKLGGKAISRLHLLTRILDMLAPDRVHIFVVSAGEGMTNLLEKMYQAGVQNDLSQLPLIEEFRSSHRDIIRKHDLWLYNDRAVVPVMDVNRSVLYLSDFFSAADFSEIKMAELLAQGELLTSKIFRHFACSVTNEQVAWADSRRMIATTGKINAAEVVPQASSVLTLNALAPLMAKHRFIVVQGFIGSDELTGKTSVLERDGSDASAAWMANFLHSDESPVACVNFWKDVPGLVKNINARKLEIYPEVNFQELRAKVMNGSPVLHHTAIPPLESKLIPARICSYKQPESLGTLITN